MKYIITTGPTAAGKDDLMDAMAGELKAEGIDAYKPWYYTTRKELRPGEQPGDKHLLSDKEFEAMRSRGEIPYPMENAGYQIGYPQTELEKGEVVVMTLSGVDARRQRDKVREQGHEAFMIYLYAPKEDRIERIRHRGGPDGQMTLIYEPAFEKVNNDAERADLDSYADYDLRIENKEGKFNEIFAEIMPKVREFVHAR